ncbi:signal recognition particle-docking protein FtsY [Tumidithrix elongata RA019]|uniref:Signal recognition particle receptor FtsY n=1 Tax=Tumidithrix elongata BACA0141 TaxID=2716417 RepID=A0AAW9PYU7_9CYAN|nr:signal recognition particle-docking protein FtsY [Tumidithrix elongata RA019]
MVFNWFRRKFDDEKQSEEQSVEEQKAESQAEAEPVAPPAETTATSTPQSQDLLNWAKAAYVNIQKQQTEVVQPEVITESTPATEPESEPDSAPTSELVTEPPPEPPTESAEPVATEPIAETISEPIAEAATPDISVEAEAELLPETIAAEPAPEPITEPNVEPSSEFIPDAVPETTPELVTAPPVEASLESEPEAIAAAEPIAEIVDIIDAGIPETIPETAAESIPETAAESITETAVEAVPTLTVEEPVVTDAPTVEPTPEPSPEPTPEPTPEPVIETVAEPVASESVPDNLPEASTFDPNEEPTVPLPFWMQSESDRLARIAALEANAIVEPEPETPQPVVVTQTKTQVQIPIYEPQLPFDESFLWSAEVLASQGRRPEEISAEEITWLKRLRQGLDKTRLTLVNQLKALVGKGPLGADDVDEIEALLLQADVGVQATDKIVQALQTKLRNEVLPPEAAIAFLKQILREMLDAPLLVEKKGANKKPPVANLVPEKNQLNIWLITGVNGAGKTTTIGKLAHIANKSGYKTLIAAADTFRAAAVQQVQAWGERSQVEVIANTGKNTDPAAVVFDAIIAAQARGSELLLIDTAGRLQNKNNLMEELSKIRRIVDKKAPEATIESLLVLDATLGQNGLRQAEVFSKSAGISGVVLTKLDGTAKGGVAIAVVEQLGLPIRFIGAGEGIEDLRPFSSYEFVEALLSN